MGSGTTAVAAKNLKRQYIGFEINKEYFDLSQLRLGLKQDNCVSKNENILTLFEPKTDYNGL